MSDSSPIHRHSPLDLEVLASPLPVDPPTAVPVPRLPAIPDKAVQVLWNQAIFLVTGLLSTLGMQWLNYRNAADAKSMLTVLATYIGMVAVFLVPSSGAKVKVNSAESTVSHKGVLFVAFLDVLGNVVLTAGQFAVGSGLFQVIYASMVVFTAVFSRCFLNKRLGLDQWGYLFLIVFGLSLNVGGGPTETDKAGHIGIEVLIPLTGTCIYAGVLLDAPQLDTLNDFLMSNASTRPMTPRQQCFWVGMYSGILTVFLMVIVSIPTIRQMPLTDPKIISMYIFLILSSLGHNITYFQLLERTGAVATGVLQALRAVMVFALSHVFFCQEDERQCFTARKGVATVVVVLGVLGYSFAKARSLRDPKHMGFERVPDILGEDVALEDLGKIKP
ncbi:hypothetical protein DFS34DRAFT_591985 [Phlyctochytrium arcticum]|nr:hypothetical protein DFS34DRAFT_591985 [Phlyctochytrium arcticum]